MAEELELEEVRPGRPHTQICLGVLGKREDISQEDMREKIIHPMLSLLKNVPNKINLSSDGQSSALIGAWADRCEIENEVIRADFRKLGRRAFAMRDARILKDASHILIFEQPKSEYLVKVGIREMKKGRTIFSVSPGKNWGFQEWVFEQKQGEEEEEEQEECMIK